VKRFLLLFVVACGGRTDLGGHHADADASALPTVPGVVVNDCAPNDAPAIAFAFAMPGATVVPSCPNSVVSALSVRISFWSPIPKGPGEYAIASGSLESGSIAVYCPAKGQCIAADHGTLTLTDFSSVSAAGSFTLVMPDNTTIGGNFAEILVCQNPSMCG
jgi:hypothetical protein